MQMQAQPFHGDIRLGVVLLQILLRLARQQAAGGFAVIVRLFQKRLKKSAELVLCVVHGRACFQNNLR